MKYQTFFATGMNTCDKCKRGFYPSEAMWEDLWCRKCLEVQQTKSREWAMNLLKSQAIVDGEPVL